MADKVDAAVEKLMSGYNCTQAVLYAYCDEFGLDKNSALKLSCGFGGGMGRAQEVCGAVTGGILALGAIYGRGENDGRAAMDATYGKTKELLARFRSVHGSYICRELLDGCDLNTEEGKARFKQSEMGSKVCKECVKSTVGIVESMRKSAVAGS